MLKGAFLICRSAKKSDLLLLGSTLLYFASLKN
jgi:hypothetical protein